MSGPIVRKYGFPNFEKIFGERELKHGTDAGASTPAPDLPPADPAKPAREAEAEPGKDQGDPPKP